MKQTPLKWGHRRRSQVRRQSERPAESGAGSREALSAQGSQPPGRNTQNKPELVLSLVGQTPHIHRGMEAYPEPSAHSSQEHPLVFVADIV